VIDPRIYRAGSLPALIALVVVMFSVEPLPEPLDAPAPTGFESGPAARAARGIVAAAPARTPGSEDDTVAADFVAERFGAIEGGELSEQTFESSFDGEDVELRNEILVLPGESERQVVLLAARDSARGPGYASSAAATGALIEIAENFGGARHNKTLVFVSTAGGSDGATGAREFAAAYPDLDLIDAAIVIEQPGAAEPSPPHVIPWSAGSESTSIQLTRTAAAVVTEQIDAPAGEGAPLGGLFRLALPSGLGEQSVLIEDGIDAVGISSAGERALPPSRDGSDSLSAVTVGQFGRAALALVAVLDAVPGSPQHGSDAYIQVAGNLVPGWSLGLLGLTLLLPSALAAVDAVARSWRRGEGRPRDVAWAVSRSLPFVGALVLALVMAVTGIVPRPRFPFDPGRFEIGWRAAAVFVCLTAAFALAWIAVRPLRVPRETSREALGAATGLVLCAALVGLWLLNSYLALLVVPATHAWLAVAAPPGSLRVAGVAGALAGTLILPLWAVADLAGRLEVGITVPWHLVLMVVGGQLGSSLGLLACVIAGSLVALVAAALGAPEGGAQVPRLSARSRG
jgi:hypothetical protein